MNLPEARRCGINRRRAAPPAAVKALIHLHNSLSQDKVDEHGQARP
jgi:hypothetical protein